MAAVGPVTLDEVRERAGRASHRCSSEDPPRDRYGRVLVTTPEDARGRGFAVVFVPGLAERLFPQRPREDPLLLDALRGRLSRRSADAGSTATEHERLLLRLAVGAAPQRVYLSYPRVDVVRARPRVTSFYGLDVGARHARRPSPTSRRSSATPTPRCRPASPGRRRPSPARAIDDAEHDLSMLGGAAARRARALEPKGGAHYLLELNPHLGALAAHALRALGAHAWSELDGMIRSHRGHRAAAGARSGSRRAPTRRRRCSSSPPARTVLPRRHPRLEPRDEAAPLEQPRSADARPARSTASRPRRCAPCASGGALPLGRRGTAPPRSACSPHARRASRRSSDELAPPIARVWQDEIAALRGDLRQLAAPSGRRTPRSGSRATSSSASACRPTRGRDPREPARAGRAAGDGCPAARLGRPGRAPRRRRRAARHRPQDRRRPHRRRPGRRRRRDPAAGALRPRRRSGPRRAGAPRRACSTAPRAAASPSASCRSTRAPAPRARGAGGRSTAPSPPASCRRRRARAPASAATSASSAGRTRRSAPRRKEPAPAGRPAPRCGDGHDRDAAPLADREARAAHPRATSTRT